LVNTGKYAGSDLAVLRIESEINRLRITLDDFGPGFDEDAELRTEGGVANSIHERCTRAGVESSLNSSGSNGVRLELRWQAPQSSVEAEREDFVLGSALAVATTEVVCWVIVRMVVGIPFDWDLAPWWWWLIMLILVCGGAMMGLISARRNFYITRPICVVIIGLVAVIAAVPSPMAGMCLEPGDGTWQALGATTVAITIAWLTPGFGWTAAAVVALIVGWASELFAVYMLYGCPTDRGLFLLIFPAGVLALWLIRRYVEAFGRNAQASLQEFQRIREADSDATSRQSVRQRIWDSAVVPSLPLLRDIADGRRDPLDPQVRAEAELRESLLRNCVQLDAGLEPVAGVILQACQQAADRQIGVAINYAQPPSASPQTLSKISETLKDFVAQTKPRQQLAITAIGIGSLGSITCSCTDPDDEDLRSTELTWLADDD